MCYSTRGVGFAILNLPLAGFKLAQEFILSIIEKYDR
jgi:hypothetical protein